MNSVGVSALCFQHLHDPSAQLVPAPDSRERRIACSAELHYERCIGRTASVEYQIQSDSNLFFFSSLSLYLMSIFLILQSSKTDAEVVQMTYTKSLIRRVSVKI